MDERKSARERKRQRNEICAFHAQRQRPKENAEVCVSDRRPSNLCRGQTRSAVTACHKWPRSHAMARLSANDVDAMAGNDAHALKCR